jgi:hypothetical protein
MVQTVCIILGGEDRERLEAIASDRSRPLKHIQRAKIVLFSAVRLPVLEVARRAGVSRPAVWRWQQCFAEEGVDGLLREDPQTSTRAARAKSCRQSSRIDLLRAAGRRHPLDRQSHGQGRWRQLARRATHLGKASSQAASPPHLQTLDRSEIRREGRNVVGL